MSNTTLLLSTGKTTDPRWSAEAVRVIHISPPSQAYQWSKRLFDILLAVLVLTIGLPLFMLLALMTRLSSPGPVLYRQERIGRGGKPFFIYKFRSMYVDAEAAGPCLSSGQLDTRITRWGWIMRRNRLDELPQFYNVLIGDMSLVGPRPERQFYIDQLVKRVPDYGHLLRVRPGITSLGQVRYGYAASLEEMIERVEYDLTYLRRQSLGLDGWILLQTIGVMFRGIGR